MQTDLPYTRIANDVQLDKGAVVHSFANLYGCLIGEESTVGPFVEIQKGAAIGRRCKISSHTFICEGVTIEDEVFVGHGVMFTNDRYPKAVNEAGTLAKDGDWCCEKTIVRRGASIGSGVTVLCGLEIGENAMIGAGSVVTKSVPANTVVAGNPARVIS